MICVCQVWNMASGEQHELGGCLGQVLARYFGFRVQLEVHVQVWNMASGEQHELGGCLGQVLARYFGFRVQLEVYVQVWNMSSGEQHELGGCLGQVLALTATHGMLIAGGQDSAIRVWKLNAASQRFEPQARVHCRAALCLGCRQPHHVTLECMACCRGTGSAVLVNRNRKCIGNLLLLHLVDRERIEERQTSGRGRWRSRQRRAATARQCRRCCGKSEQR